MYFGHKHVEFRPSCSHELTTFLKYHIPLRVETHLEGQKITRFPRFRGYNKK